jgi:hypothetical protein
MVDCGVIRRERRRSVRGFRALSKTVARDRDLRRHVYALGLFLAIAGLCAGGICLAQPEPPRRPVTTTKPAAKPTHPAPPRQPAPQPAPPIEPAAPQGRIPIDVDPATLQPYNLPAASRETMRRCGDEGRKMKMLGRANGLSWRSFAEKCLVR